MRSSIIDVPFPFTAEIAKSRQRSQQQHFLGRLTVEIPDVDILPDPVYSVGTDDHDRIEWFNIGGKLLRPVLRGRVPALISEIEQAQELLPYLSHQEMFWFADHPAAVYPLPRYSFIDAHAILEEGFEGVRSIEDDQADSAAFFRNVYASCIRFGDTLLAPAHPPTWRVLSKRGNAYITIAISRSDGPFEPLSFHFGIEQQETAVAFAHFLAGAGDVRTDLLNCRWSSDVVANLEDGALATARWWAARLLKRYVRSRLGNLERKQIGGLVALRRIYDDFGHSSDLVADRALLALEEVSWAFDKSLPHALGQMLAQRRRLISEFFTAMSELDDFVSDT